MNLYELMAALRGKKTYLTVALGYVLLFGRWQGWWVIPDEIYVALTGLALVFIRNAIGAVAPASSPAPTSPAAIIPFPKASAALLAAAGLALAGCTMTQQRIATNTLYSLEQSTTAAVDAYDSLVIQGALPTNDVPRVTRLYNTFQASFLVALDAVQFNTNAIAPPSLAVESQDLVNLINTIKGAK